jgi:hypothetical protein
LIKRGEEVDFGFYKAIEYLEKEKEEGVQCRINLRGSFGIRA